MTDEDEWIQLSASVEEVCGHIFDTASDVLKNVQVLGFDKLLLVPKPNAEDKMLHVRLFDSLFTALITFFEQNDKFDLVKQLINAKQQILLLEMLINSVKSKNLEECNRLVAQLGSQKS